MLLGSGKALSTAAACAICGGESWGCLEREALDGVGRGKKQRGEEDALCLFHSYPHFKEREAEA